MTKLVLAAVMTLMALTNTQAQKFNLGVKGGINFTRITGDNAKEFDPVTAFSIGVVAETKISEKFSFQPELLFSGKGYGIEDDVRALNYLSLPLMGKYYLTKGLSVEAGPQFEYLLTAKQESTDIKDAFNKVDVGAAIGLGYKFDSGLNFGARFTKGLSDINNIDGLTDSNKLDVFQVSIGYFFF